MQAMPEAGQSQRGRVLVVEDEATIAMVMEDMLSELGFEVVGPFARLAEARDAAEREALDVAVMDVNVAGEPIYPVAEALARRGIPFVFSTGYAVDGIQEPYRGRPILEKPFSQAELDERIRTAIAAGGGA